MALENFIAIDPVDVPYIPFVEARGDDEDTVHLGLKSKGFTGQIEAHTSVFNIKSWLGGAYGLRVFVSEDAVNYSGISSAGAGASPAHQVVGADTDINYDMYPKGGGRARVNSATGLENVPTVVAAVNTTGLFANVASTVLYTPPSTRGGMYRISAYVVLTATATASSTLPNVQVTYWDADIAASVTLNVTPTLAAAGLGQTETLSKNVVGLIASGVVVINVDTFVPIRYQTVNYASVTADEMTYALHIICEKL